MKTPTPWTAGSGLLRFLKRVLPLLATISLLATADATTLYVSAYNEYEVTGNIMKVSETGVATVWDISWDNGQQLEDPEGLALDAAGNLYVNDGYYVFKITPDGQGTTFATKASDYQAYGMAIDAAGNVYVGSALPDYNSSILKYSPQGELLATWSTRFVFSLAIGPDGSLYATESFNGSIGKYDTNTGARTQYADGMNFPEGLAFDKNGNAFVGDADNKLLILKIGEGGVPVEQFSKFKGFVSMGLDIDEDGNIYSGIKASSNKSDRNQIMITDENGNTTLFSQLASTQRPNDIVVVVPEPGSVVFLVSGLVIMIWIGRRHRVQRAS